MSAVDGSTPESEDISVREPLRRAELFNALGRWMGSLAARGAPGGSDIAPGLMDMLQELGYVDGQTPAEDGR